MPSSLRIRACFIAATALLTFTSHSLAQIQSGVAVDLVRDPIVESHVVTLLGNTHPLARAEFDRGAIPDETRLERMVLLLRSDAARQQELDALVEAQQKPGSGSYHQWLSPEEYGSRFGASPADLMQITAWLEGHGFTLEPVSTGRRLVIFSGTAGQVAEAFHTEMHLYEVDGARHVANSEDPQIPTALAPVLGGIVSLHDFRRISAMRSIREVAGPGTTGLETAGAAQAEPQNTQGSTHYIFPADFATIYDLNPQYAAGRNGSGASIAIVGRSNINLSDVSSFRGGDGLVANQPSVILEGANPGLVPEDQDESTLDVEWSGAVAPGAAVKFVVAASTATSDGVDLSAQYIVNHKTATVMSTSYGNCEAYMGAGAMAFYNSLWEQAASEGISAFVSAGDSGAAGCSAGSSSKGSVAGVNGLCSSPYSTCVGGTEFNEGSGKYWASTNGAGGGSALAYIPEKVWNESGSDGGSGLWSSGGGVSEFYEQPSWQKGVPGANSNAMRAVPDVALTAASHDGYMIYENGSWYVIAGTSAASPSFAGIMSIVDQKEGAAGQGNANPTLYGLLDANESPFHATPSGNNSVPGVNGFTASGAAYNLATGLGSVDANLLVNEWPSAAGSGPQQGFTLKTSATTESLLPGKSATFTVAVTGTGGFNGSVSLTAKTPSGVTLSFNPASVKAGASSTATLTVASATAAGTGNITITGTNGSIAGTATVAITVLAPPTLSVTIGASKITVIQGKTATLAVTTTTGGVYSGLVALAVTGLPSGVTAAWSASGFSASGAGSTVSTLTLKAAAGAALTTGTLKIAATGDGLSAQSSAALQVTAAPAIAVALTPAAIGMKSTAMQQVTVMVAPVGGVVLSPSASEASFKVTGLPTGITASWGAPSLSGGYVTAMLTLTGSNNAISSSTKPTITVQMSDVATKIVYTASTVATLTVTRANSLAVSVTSTALSVGKGKSVTDGITVSTAGSFDSAVSFTVSGLPQGVTAAWSANSVTPNLSSGEAAVILTLKAASTATLASGTLVITATGGGVSGTKSVAVQVGN